MATPLRMWDRLRPIFSWRIFWMMVGVAGLAGVTAELVHPASSRPAPGTRPDRPAARQLVELTPEHLIRIDPAGLLDEKLKIVAMKKEQIERPLILVTGTIAARTDDATTNRTTNWQFASAELHTTYVNLLNARTEEAFARNQLVKIRELSIATVKSHRVIVDRLKKLVASGTDAPKDLAAAETALAQAELQGQKDIFEADSTWTKAQTSADALVRDLKQAAIDPELLEKAPPGTVLVVAEVPEARVAELREGVACEASFYAFPGKTFPGKVGKLATVLSTERRTLRVPFQLLDPERKLKPGMFAEVGLGTEPRSALYGPDAGVLHVGRFDYMLMEQSTGLWKVVQVHVGEPFGGRIEILSGVSEGSRVMGDGAILLKPFVIQALQRP